MRYSSLRQVLFFTSLLLITACSTAETGVVDVAICPVCDDAYDGFDSCAFFDADNSWAREGMLVDDENHAGIGIPIRQNGYMHHKFCFNATHAVFGSANPTLTGLTKNDNYVITVQSATLALALSSEYDYLQGRGSGRHTRTWSFNDKPLEVLFCPRDGCEQRVLEVLSSANSSIRFLAFSFTSDSIGDALIAADLRGVLVQGVVEPWGANGRGSEYPRLSKAGLDIVLADSPGLMHAKAFVVDDKVAVVGSYNPTASGTSRNAETLVITYEPDIVLTVLDMHAALR